MTPNDLAGLLDRIGIDIARDSNGNFMACCPFHEEHKPSWGISQSEPHWHGCFSCPAKGTLYDLLIRIGEFKPDDARRICKLGEADPAFMEFESPFQKEYSINPELLYPYVLTKKARRYMEGRGIPRAISRQLGLLYHHKDNRVLFPWYLHDKLVGVTGRSLDPNDEVKTIPYFGSKKQFYLYLPGRTIRREPFVLVEGEIDAAAVFAAGRPNVGGIGHGKFSKGQMKMLLESPTKEIVCFLDDDPTGDVLFEKICKYYAGKKIISRVEYKRIPSYQKIKRLVGKLDPATFDAKQLDYILTECVSRNADWPTLD